ncbi:uncharacterized protein COX7B [Prorops nasuta]|uniref:uncharacterized protein COX7B n=1 Tax=Prorops nasuta TaxID=863751 RepID=UPI0034CE0C88
MFNQILRPVTRAVVQSGRRSYYPLKDFKLATMDDIPVPKGSWKEQYDRNQKRFNATLVTGVTALIASIILLMNTECIYFNWGPPERGTERLVPPE